MGHDYKKVIFLNSFIFCDKTLWNASPAFDSALKTCFNQNVLLGGRDVAAITTILSTGSQPLAWIYFQFSLYAGVKVRNLLARRRCRQSKFIDQIICLNEHTLSRSQMLCKEKETTVETNKQAKYQEKEFVDCAEKKKIDFMFNILTCEKVVFALGMHI